MQLSHTGKKWISVIVPVLPDMVMNTDLKYLMHCSLLMVQ